MKLYYSPGACSLSPHIVLREAAIPFELERVDTQAGRTERGRDFRTVNPKGYVPALELDHGEVLTEGPAIVQYLADLVPELELAPPAGTFERYRLQEWLNYITSELHKSLGGLFNPKMPAEFQKATRDAIAGKFDYLVKALEKKTFVLGNGFTVADAYLFVVLSWTAHLQIDLSRWPALTAYQARVSARPAVKAALMAEGLA
ncbi:MAG TPA: glutathione transferase GstA [Anaeromyxobacteraceae bacterium]|nr:glutathione transferase GstA [Anaeromyxobacteraceae bacterium]